MPESAKSPTIKPAGKDMNGTGRIVTYVLSGVAIIVLSTSIITMGVHLANDERHESREAKENRIRVIVRDMVESPPREITQRLDRLENEVREMKTMLRDMVLAMANMKNKGD